MKVNRTEYISHNYALDNDKIEEISVYRIRQLTVNNNSSGRIDSDRGVTQVSDLQTELSVSPF